MTTPLVPVTDRYTYHVLTAAAKMPGKCRGVYKRVAVLRVDHHEREVGFVPKTIREMRGVEVVRTWERCNVGKTNACAYKVALCEAEQFAAAECRTEAQEQAA